MKQILTIEDRAVYSGLNTLIAATETAAYGRSINAAYLSSFSHEDIINGIAMHIDAAKRFQPKEFMLIPELVYIQLGKLDQTMIDGLSRRYFDEGFGDKADTILYDTKAIRVDDASWATYQYGSTRSKFGENAATELAMYQAAGYDIAAVGDLLTKYGVDHNVVDSFIRVLIFPPRNFLGKALLWGSDIKTNLKYENEYVSFYSSEWLALILHNNYAPTAIDLWYKAR